MKADRGTTKDKDQEERSRGSAAQEQREEANKEAPGRHTEGERIEQER